MSTTIKLPYIRYVRQVSNGSSRSKYSFLAMMRENAAALETAKWALAKSKTAELTVNQLTRTDGVFNPDTGEYTTVPTYTAYLDDRYDCFCQAGDAVKSRASLCGYAGIVAYRFTLPTTNPGAIDSLSLRIQRDRYLRSGVRAVAVLSNSATPSDDWSVIRGTASGSIVSPSVEGGEESGIESFGFLGQPDVAYLLAGRADEGTLTFDAEHFPALENAASYAYLYIYLSPEDLAGSWTWYNETDPRSYYIEGSAILVPADTTFTFATAAVPPSEARSFELVRGGVVPSFEATEALSPVLQVTVQKNGDPIGYNSIKQLAATVVGNGGTVMGVRTNEREGLSTPSHYHYAAIFGYGFPGTWTDLPGLVLYDIRNREMVKFNTALGISASMAQLVADGIMGVMDCYVAGNKIVPLFGQIGHTNPQLTVDGTACTILTPTESDDYITCPTLTFDSSDGYRITGAASGGSVEVPHALIGKPWSGPGVVPLVATDGEIVSTQSWKYFEDHPEYDRDHRMHVDYVGTVKGIVACSRNATPGHDATSEDVAAKQVYFVWGAFTSIGGVSCSRCAFITFYKAGSADNAMLYGCDVTVPDIDSDQNWPTLGSLWSVCPQLPSIDENGNEIAADYNSFLVCGCTEGGTRRFVTGVWYATDYDEALVFGREIPHVGVIGHAPGYGGFFPATIATESISIPITDAAAGLRALYGRFRAYGLTAVPNVTQQIGAAFSVSWKECQLKSSGVKIGSWQIAAAALVVPFGCPEFDASEIEFDWTGWTGARTAGTKFHVWLARRRFTAAPAEIIHAEVWGNGSASGLEYVGEIDPTGAATSATLTLARPLAGGVATLIVTASVSMDAANPSSSPTLPMGASTLAVNMADGTVENGGTAFMPNITLH